MDDVQQNERALHWSEKAADVTETVNYAVGIGGVVCSFFVLKWLNQILNDPSIITGSHAGSFYHQGVSAFKWMAIAFITIAALKLLSGIFDVINLSQQDEKKQKHLSIAVCTIGNLLLIGGFACLGIACFAHSASLNNAADGTYKSIGDMSTKVKMHYLIAAMVMIGFYCLVKGVAGFLHAFSDEVTQTQIRDIDTKDKVILTLTGASFLTLITGLTLFALDVTDKVLIIGAAFFALMVLVNILRPYIAPRKRDEKHGLHRHCYGPMYKAVSGFLFLAFIASFITAGATYATYSDLGDSTMNTRMMITLSIGIVAFACFFAMKFFERLDKHTNPIDHSIELVPGHKVFSGAGTLFTNAVADVHEDLTTGTTRNIVQQ